MHYHKVRGGPFPTYAAHREKDATRTPDISQVGYIRKGALGWYAETPNGLPIGEGHPTEEGAKKTLEQFAASTVARASWLR